MWFTNLQIVLPDRVIARGALQIQDGKIAAIVEGDSPAIGTDSVIDLTGLTALPGAIDVHGDMLERDIEPRPGATFPIDLSLFELDKRLASTGVTTAYSAISFAISEADKAAQVKAQQVVAAIHKLHPVLLVDHKVHARIEVGNPDTPPIVARMIDAGQVQMVSVMDHTPGQGQYRKIDRYVDSTLSDMFRWLGVNPQTVSAETIGSLKAALVKADPPPRDWETLRPILAQAYAQHIPTASHDDDTAAKIDLMAGMHVTISEFPVTLEAAKEAKARGMAVVMGAPNAYRGVSTGEGNLSARNAIRAGVVDILAADYYPTALIQAAFRVAAEGIIPLPDAINLVSRNPAQACGLVDRGQIAIGFRADLVLVEVTDPQPRIRATFRDGTPIYLDRALSGYFGRIDPAPIALTGVLTDSDGAA